MNISPTVRKHLKLFIIAIIVVIILDQIIQAITAVAINQRPVNQPGPFWHWSAHQFLGYTGLSGAAALNSTLQEVWFAETMAFILTPLALIWFYRRLDWKFWTPWILTGVVAFFAVCANMDRVYSGARYVSPPQFTETLHDGAYSPIHRSDKDYMLESVFGEFVVAQLLFIVPFSLGYLAAKKPDAKV